MALVLALFWVPAAAHCLLEQTPLLPAFLACDQGTSPAHQPDGCQQDACQVVESGLYVPTVVPIHIPSPDEIFFPVWAAISALPSPAERAPGVFLNADVTADESPPWQFLLRAAPTPRAPSSLL